MYVAVFYFLHPGRCTCAPLLRHVRASTTTRARLYIDQYICTYTFATRMTMLHTLRPGGSRLPGTSLPAKMSLVGPSSQGGESFFFCPDALPCVRRCSRWVPAVRGANRFFCPDALPCVRRCCRWVPAVRGANRFFSRTHFLACEGVAGGSQQSGGRIIFFLPGRTSLRAKM